MSLRINEEQKAKAIIEYAKCGTLTKAAKSIGFNRITLREETKRCNAFKIAMENAKQEYVDSLEVVLDTKIRDDSDKASAILLMFRLKKERPEYRDKVEHKVDTNIRIISAVPRPKSER